MSERKNPENGTTASNANPKSHKKKNKALPVILVIAILACGIGGYAAYQKFFAEQPTENAEQETAENNTPDTEETSEEESESVSEETENEEENSEDVQETAEESQDTAEEENGITPGAVEYYSLDPSWTYAEYSKINSGTAVMYRASTNRKNYVVAVNAGHGTSGGSSVQTQCHPDGSAKVTGGSTSAGSTYATAVAGGATMNDGTSEADAVLALAQIVKETLLAEGYDVLMIRDGSDVQLDNIARTVIANNVADCHIALHYDSTTSDKGAFYISTPDVASYRNMEPVASHWQEHHALGDSLIAGLRNQGVKISGSGSMAIDLTQTSYSTIPSIDLEVGDRASDHSSASYAKIAAGIAEGINNFAQ